MKYILFIILLLAGSITYAQEPDDFIVVIVNNKDCALSTKVKKLFTNTAIVSGLRRQQQKLFIVDVHEHLEYAKILGTKYLPTTYRIKRVNGKLRKVGIFDPTVKTYTESNLLKFLGIKMRTPVQTPRPST